MITKQGTPVSKKIKNQIESTLTVYNTYIGDEFFEEMKRRYNITFQTNELRGAFDKILEATMPNIVDEIYVNIKESETKINPGAVMSNPTYSDIDINKMYSDITTVPTDSAKLISDILKHTKDWGKNGI